MRFRNAVLVGLLAIVLGFSGFLPLGGGLLGSFAALGWARWLFNLSGSGKFVKVSLGPDVYRLDLWWRPLPFALLPLTSILIKDASGSWVLIDAGAGDSWSQSYATRLAAAVKVALPRGAQLEAILLTHAHWDHIGALPQLLAAYPAARVALHEREAPFLAGERSYLPPGSAVVRAAQVVGLARQDAIKVDPSRLHLLRGGSGDLSALGLTSLSWVATPGHSPGHVSYTHAPSGTLIVGDALANAWPTLAIEGGLAPLLTYSLRPFGRAGSALAGTAGGGLLRLLPASLADALPVGVARLVDKAFEAAGSGSTGSGSEAGARKEQLVSGGLSVGAGDERSEGTVVQGGPVKGQPAGAVKVPFTFGLPKLVVKVTPFLITPHPTGDVADGHRSICTLAALSFKCALPMHDIPGKGLSREELQAVAASLPPFKKQM